MSKAKPLCARTLRVMARRLWLFGRKQARENAYFYAQGIFTASVRCAKTAELIERKAKASKGRKRDV